ncbi:Uu.00g062530.m01.CDS01 [Anthostomella pinea]|uniref:Uu.00g062530.m01.CDS01 n=1 Tax=Anthostomella pinea TaxID=933095 RepID=A0AAI8VT83_9PEZI|nr:Uu.00g062530.m01.CDS01 [Anthostomella pinea]
MARFIEVTVRGQVLGKNVYDFVSHHDPPTTAQVNQESRAVACRSGKLVPIRNPRMPVAEYRDLGMNPRFRTRWAWFDPTRDTLSLSFDDSFSPTPDHGRGVVRHPLSGFFECAQSVIVGTRVMKYQYICPALLCKHLFDPRNFPFLKSVDFVTSKYDLPERSDHVLETRLFGPGRVHPRILHLDDTAGIESLMTNLVQGHTSIHVDELERFVTAAISDEEASAWRYYSEQLRSAWTFWYPRDRSCEIAPPEEEEEEKEEEESHLSVKRLDMMCWNMPTFRRVILLRRARYVLETMQHETAH